MKENTFERTQEVKRFDDFRGLDLSSKDFRNVSVEVLLTTDFDNQTKWPNKKKLPDNFKPKVILEMAKNPGLGLRDLHNQGITGKGINVAIIDQKLDVNHKEYSDNIIDYKEVDSENEDISMHGPGVASLFVGKNCGVAPEAKLHYISVPSGDNSNWESTTEALKNIINFNSKAEEKEKIKIVSYSNGYPNPAFKGDLKKFEDTVNEVRKNGIIFMEANSFFDLNFIGGGSMDSDKEDVNKYKLWLAIENKIKMFDDINSSWNTKNRIIIPCDGRTVASSWNKKEKEGLGEYCYMGRGGVSWSIPYLSGIIALMLQVNKNIKLEEMTKIIQDTVHVNEEGSKIINPSAAIESIKNHLNKFQ